MKGMRVSQAYGLNRNQSTLDFLDINLVTDIPVFLDATAIRSLESPWGHELKATLNNFFNLVLSNIRNGDHDAARNLLASLSESNEYHLGLSTGRSRGHAFGAGSARTVWSALANDKSNVVDLLDTIEDSILLVDGIGKDMISDAISNILRGPFIRFTQDACGYYGIPLVDQIESGPLWDVKMGCWDSALVRLPCHEIYGRFILVPKNIVRHQITCDAHDYYRHHLLPVMQRYEISIRSRLVQHRKNLTPFVTKKDLMEKYGANKLAIARQTELHPDALAEYKRFNERNATAPLSHNQVSDFVKEDRTDWDAFVDRLENLPTGRSSAGDYENLIEQIFTALFYPSLCNPDKQVDIHEGRKRIDITYTNEAREGFFYWIKNQLPSLFIIVECKNYGGEISNPEVDQLAGRFSPSRGKVGILVYRSISDRVRLDERCKDTAREDRGWIVNIDDSDLIALIKEKQREENIDDVPQDELRPEDRNNNKYTRLRELMTALVS
jgi:hypothetical protein